MINTVPRANFKILSLSITTISHLTELLGNKTTNLLNPCMPTTTLPTKQNSVGDHMMWLFVMIKSISAPALTLLTPRACVVMRKRERLISSMISNFTSLSMRTPLICKWHFAVKLQNIVTLQTFSFSMLQFCCNCKAWTDG